jgi:hypothetical protein
VCGATGLKIDRNAELLMRAHAVVATVALLIGGITAIGVLLTRWQAVHLLDAADVLPRADDPRDEHADLLHPLLRDGGPVLRELRAAEHAACRRRRWGGRRSG